MIDYLIANMWQVWAVIAVVCLILELSSGDFFIICFSIGAVFALISAVVGLNIVHFCSLLAAQRTLRAPCGLALSPQERA